MKSRAQEAVTFHFSLITFHFFPMSPQLEELWLEHAVAAFDRQLRLAEWLGEHDWQWEAHSGQLLLRRHAQPDEVVSWATQALGSESHMAQTWLWIWANDLAELPDEVLRAAHQLRALGDERGIPELTQGEFPLIEADGHVLSLIASGLLKSDAYYRGPYVGGAGFVLINDANFPPAPTDSARVPSVFRAALSALPIADHRRAFVAYLRHLGWIIEEKSDAVIARSGDWEIEARFDESSRLLALNSAERRNSLQN